PHGSRLPPHDGDARRGGGLAADGHADRGAPPRRVRRLPRRGVRALRPAGAGVQPAGQL
ncbi:MAG: hypothetical protein AVDCRST_MAG04-2490, partial [uncultured Acetobacteraceae bacterium]